MVLNLFKLASSINRIHSGSISETESISRTDKLNTESKEKLSQSETGTSKEGVINTPHSTENSDPFGEKGIVPFLGSHLNPIVSHMDETNFPISTGDYIGKIEEKRETGEIYNEFGNKTGSFKTFERKKKYETRY